MEGFLDLGYDCSYDFFLSFPVRDLGSLRCSLMDYDSSSSYHHSVSRNVPRQAWASDLVIVSATQTEGKLNGVGTWTELVTRVFVIEFASDLEKGCGEMRRSPTTLWFTLWLRDERAMEQNL